MRTHHSLKAWQEARAVALLAIHAARSHWKPWAAALFAQLLRASLSVQLNIAEGATFNRSPTYARHLGIAYGSAVETGEILELLRESEVIPVADCKPMLQHCACSQKLLVGLLKRHRPMA
jgi:four helix bundle protein